jgi:hypothetical protein
MMKEYLKAFGIFKAKFIYKIGQLDFVFALVCLQFEQKLSMPLCGVFTIAVRLSRK